MRSVFYTFLSLCCLLFLNSCSAKESYVPIDVSNTENLATSPQWAVITEPYAAYRTMPSAVATVDAHGRIGDIIEVIGSTINISGKTRELWYQFETGWLPKNLIGIYSNKLKAEFAASQFK